MGRLKVVGVIPARLASERLPNKVLLELDGKAMVHHVYANARTCPLLDELLIATDAEPVRDYCQRNGIPVIAITQRPTSFLGRNAAVCLTMPKVAEACPNGLWLVRRASLIPCAFSAPAIRLARPVVPLPFDISIGCRLTSIAFQ